MKKKNIVYIAKSLDGFIADKNESLDWLEIIPNPKGSDMGFMAFMGSIDGIVMGRNTFEMVAGFDGDWPYPVPVFVLSTTLTSVDEKFKDKVQLVKGSIKEILAELHAKGFGKLYIDGGKTIQSFLAEDLIDEMIITTMPILLGGGISLFGDLPQRMEFTHVESKVFLKAIVQDTYLRK